MRYTRLVIGISLIVTCQMMDAAQRLSFFRRKIFGICSASIASFTCAAAAHYGSERLLVYTLPKREYHRVLEGQPTLTKTPPVGVPKGLVPSTR